MNEHNSTKNYKKFIKYKNKLNQLKNIINERESIDSIYNDPNNNLYLIFTTGKLVEKTNQSSHNVATNDIAINKKRKSGEAAITANTITTTNTIKRKRKTPTNFTDYILNLTPEIKLYVKNNENILNHTYFSDDLINDQKIIDRFEAIIEQKDEAYVNYENRGKLIECWIADNLKCPCCNENSLRRYYRDNFPAIDLVCINQLHTFELGVRFFQIKTSLKGSLFNGAKYFDLKNNFIHVGSRKFGNIIHDIQIDDNDIVKKNLVGYICIEYVENDKFIKISNGSFLVLPKTYTSSISIELFANDIVHNSTTNSTINSLNDSTTNQNHNKKYYWYLTEEFENNQIIKFNLIHNNVIPYNEIYTNDKIIPKNYIETNDWTPIENPLNCIN